MSFYVESSGGFENTPPGMHLARCYQIIDLGTQKSEYDGIPKFNRTLMISWEIHGNGEDGHPIVMKDGRPFSQSNFYNLSWSEKANLRKDLQSWRGKPFNQEELRRFDLKNVLGAWCMVNVIEKENRAGKVKSVINGITPVPAVIKQSGLPQAFNTNIIFNLQDPDLGVYDILSEYIKGKIQSSPEWQKLQGKPTTAPIIAKDSYEDGDIPF
jgi:hypothetical protein